MNRAAFYPESIRNGKVDGSLYIYFNSLKKSVDPGPQIYRAAVEYINHDIRKANDNTDLSEIQAAFSFLDNVIASESAKEAAFLDFLNNELKEEQAQYNIPSTESDWRNFVELFQTRLHVGEQGIDELKNELARLKINQTRYNNGLDYIKDDLTRTQTRLTQMFGALNGAQNKNQGRALLVGILNRYGKQLFQIDSKGNMILNKNDILGLLTIIGGEISEFYSSTFKNTKEGYTGSNTFNIGQIDKILNENVELDEKIQNLIERTQKMPFLSQGIVSSLHLTTKNSIFTKKDRKILIDAINASKTGDQLLDNFILSLNGYQVPEDTFSIIQVHNAYAEISSLIHFSLAQGSFGGVNIGSSGSKPDNLLGYLSVNTDFLDPEKNQQYSQDYKKLKQIYDIINDLAAGFKNKNTTEYYKQQYDVWESATRRIQSIINSMSNKILKLKDCFIIEDSTKSYQSLYGQGHNSPYLTDVHGGRLGANLDDQLSKIAALQELNAISKFNKDWLYAAILNSGPGMVGSGQKQALEEYLASFVGILLFDDQVGIAKESIIHANQELEKSSKTSVHKLHLFSVNNGYYPLSYVLKLTRDNLQRNYDNLYSEIDTITETGIRVEIYGYVSEPSLNKYDSPDNYIKAWESLSESAKKSTKIRMMFLINFMNVLEGLLNPKI